MAYNKTKYVEAAQRLLNQGKVPQAIAEYQHILKYEPRDQVTLMTVGDLYIRQGDTFQAIEYFERLAQVFLSDGFLTKAIAIYKKIAKLAPEETKPLEKLAELYVQQGVMSEARPLYLQLAEVHLKNNRQAQAVTLLKKLLEAEPDNLRIQVRLADLYHAMGQNQDAVEAFVGAAERVMARGDHAEAEKLAEKALKLDAQNAAALTVRARALAAAGKRADAARLLEKVPGLESGGEQTSLLMDQYLHNQDWDQAATLAMKVFEHDPKNFALAQKLCAALMECTECGRAFGMVQQLRIAMIDAGEHEGITQLLNCLAEKMPGRLEPLEWLVDTYARTSDSFRLPDALGRLGDALAAAGKLERAKQIYEQLLDREPERESARRRLNDVLKKMGLGPAKPDKPPVPIVEAPVGAQGIAEASPPLRSPIVSAAASAPEVDARPVGPLAESDLDEDTQRFISQSLTDVDLFASYGLTQKAVSLLDAILQRAPRHTVTLEKLLDFHLGAGDERRTAELAAQLEQIYRERGDARNTDRFGELRQRFQRAAGLSDEELAAAARPAKPQAPSAVPVVEVETTLPEAAVASESAVHEVDLSEEWAAMAEQPESFPPTGREVEVSAAQDSAAIEEAERPAAADVPKAPAAHAPAAPETPVAEFEVKLEERVSEEPPAAESELAAEPAAEPSPVLEFDSDYELELATVSEDTEVPTAETHEEGLQEPAGTRAGKAKPILSADQFLAELATEIDQLGIGPLETHTPEPEPAVVGHAASPFAPASSSATIAGSAGGPLSDVFEEFRAELGEMGAEDEDLETHYNLGIAFREMGLLEEAIGEFQKVAKANDKGRAFRYGMQCCTLLGLAFMEKSQPDIAALWYERALLTPGLDSESTLALRYDLGVAQESAGDAQAALKSFSQVYAMNIDYRDVAERIAALQKAR